MTHKEIIEKAITELNETERPHKGELLPAWWVLDKILKPVDKALALLEQAESPAGEFTMVKRQIPQAYLQEPEEKRDENLTYLCQTILEACDRLDAQQQEIERLCVKNGMVWEKNKAQAERIEKLTGTVQEALSICKAQWQAVDNHPGSSWGRDMAFFEHALKGDQP